MPLLSHHSLPGGQTELERLPGGVDQWDLYIRHTLAGAAANLGELDARLSDGRAAQPRFFDACVQEPAGTPYNLPIVWNAFPKRLLSRFGRAKALQVADMLWPHPAAPAFDPLAPGWDAVRAEAKAWIRPQDEYCEWHVERDPRTQTIRRIVFTTEAPEPWKALHGTTAMDRVRDGSQAFRFLGNPQAAAEAYSCLLGQSVSPAELQWKPGAYNPYNRWNTTHGIVHLTHPVNSLCTQIRLVADSTLPRCHPDGRPITHPEAVCSALAYGDPNNHSDSTIVATINALARHGSWLTLADPMGVFIDSVDTRGWEIPGGVGPADLLRITRGALGRILRLIVESPEGSSVALDQLTINGEPLRYGGQIAECITVRTMIACVLPSSGGFTVQPLLAARRAGLPDINRRMVHLFPTAKDLPAGHVPAFLAPAMTLDGHSSHSLRRPASYDEPVLALDRIQGIAVPGFFKPHQALLGLRLGRGAALRRVADELLVLLDAGRVTSGLAAREDRERHRQRQEPLRDPLMAVALSARGLDKLRANLSASVPSAAFRQGMPARARLLGDPAASSWCIGSGETAPDLMLVVAGNSSDSVKAAVEDLCRRLTDNDGNALVAPPQFGNVLDGERRGREHFGFADGISQPAIRGRWRDGQAPGDFIAPHSLSSSDPEHDLFGLPGQHRVWPGEFVHGYPGASPDPRLPGPVRQAPEWMRDGAFLVYRRLRQHVEAFHRTMSNESARLRRLPGFEHMTEQMLAAKVVGRWPSGAPLSRAPLADDAALGAEPLLNNDFRFDDVSPPRHFVDGALAASLQAFARAQPDILGQICPVGSHIRKVNLRDQASDVGGASATQSRRILRVGVPYDDTPEDDGTGGPASPDRGLLFLCIQASIEDQFEFLQARWMNSRVVPRGPSEVDPIVGNDAAATEGEGGRFLMFGSDLSQQDVVASDRFVTMTGGGYFFVPSLALLRDLLQGLEPAP